MVAWRYQIYVIKSKAGPSGAESSAGGSTMLSAKFAEAFRGKQAEKNSAVPGFESAFSEHQELAVLCRDENEKRVSRS